MKHKKKSKKKPTIEEEIAILEAKLKGMGMVDSGRGDIPPELHLSFLRNVYEFEVLEKQSDEWGIDLGQEIRQRLGPPADPDDLSDAEVGQSLREMIELLAQFHLIVEFTDHLHDRELYRYILEHVVREPVVLGPDPRGKRIHHDCCPFDDDREWPDDYPEVANRKAWIEELSFKYLDKPLPELSVG